MKKKTWLWWSSGKDSAWALHMLLQMEHIEVDALVTSINVTAQRVAMHAVRRELVEAQATAVNLPLHFVEIPYPCPNGAYERAAHALIAEAEAAGVAYMAFGDLFLEDIRTYRETLLKDSPIECLFPLWQRDTYKLAREVVDTGVEAYLTCVDPKQLDPKFVGRRYDHTLLDDLPDTVDPCGENGEFHSFVSNSPDFKAPIAIETGITIERDGFWFADILPII